MMDALGVVGMASGQTTAQGGGMQQMLVPMLIIFAIFYFMLIRPQQRKEKDRKAMIDSLKTGDRIMFGGGILGSVTNVKDTTLVVKIADNVKIEISRGGVTRVLEKGEKIDSANE